jgi:hypothetical protein
MCLGNFVFDFHPKTHPDVGGGRRVDDDDVSNKGGVVSSFLRLRLDRTTRMRLEGSIILSPATMLVESDFR